MESKKSNEDKYLETNNKLKFEIESANGFLLIKGFENIILIQDKDKSNVLKGEEKLFDQYFSKQIDNLEDFKLEVRTNERNLFPVTISSMRYSAAAILADFSKKTIDSQKFIEFQDFFIKIKERIVQKNLCFHKFFFENSINDMLCEKIEKIEDSSQFFEKKYMISAKEFMDKIYNLISEQIPQTISNTNFNNQTLLSKLTEKLVNEDKKINLNIFFCHIFYDSKIKYNYTNLVLLGEFAERCNQEFKNSDKDQIKNLDIARRFIYDKYNYYELPIKTLPITQCKLGDNHILLLNIHGELFAFGDGTKGATGNGNRNFHITPIKINFLQREKNLKTDVKIEKIACGSRHCIALSSNKNIYSWGFGKNGRLGHGDDKDVFEPRMIEFFDITKIEKIDAADNYSAAISCVNSLFSWGCGEFNRLGHEGNCDEKLPKKVLDFSNNVYDIKCGYYSMLVLKNKELFSVGNKTLFSKNLINKNEIGMNDNPYFELHIPEKKISKIIYSSQNQKRKLAGYSSGFSFISIVTQDICLKAESQNQKNMMKLFIWGNVAIDNLYSNKNSRFVLINDDYKFDINRFNKKEKISDNNFIDLDSNNKYEQQLNVKKKPSLDEKENISKYLFDYQKKKNLKTNSKKKGELSNKKIKDIVCSDNNTVILSGDGNLYAFGSSEYNIAKNSVEDYSIPILPKLKIDSVALGREHIIIITKNYESYGWGRNSEGQLGLGEGFTGVKENPSLIEKLKNFGVLSAYAKENYSVVLDNNRHVHIFGDLSFLDNDSSSAKKYEPKAMSEWGEISDFCCGPNHFIFIVNNHNGEYELKAIGNGLYGKLGHDSEKDDNKYEPVTVKIDIDFSKYSDKQKFKIVCSRKQTALLHTYIDDKENKGGAFSNKSNLYIWGLCSRNLLTTDQINRFETLKKYNNYDNSDYFCLNTPLLISNPQIQNLVDIQITDNVFYYINRDNILEFTGQLSPKYESENPSNKIIKSYFTSKTFEKIFVGRDHAIATDTKGKLYAWGNNNYKKLGLRHTHKEKDLLLFEQKEDNVFKQKNLFYPKPQELSEINKLFQNDLKLNDTIKQELDDDNNNINNQEFKEKFKEGEKVNNSENTLNSNKNKINENKTKSEKNFNKDEFSNNDGILAQIQKIINSEFDNLENNMIDKETKMKEKMKEILEKSHFLKTNEKEAKSLKKILFNSFTFKMADPPFNITIKPQNKISKYPEEYQRYKKNYRAFLSTLYNHPCYLRNIYENIIINNQVYEEQFYKIIKQLFANMHTDEYKKLSYINLIKNIFQVYLKKKTFDNLKDQNKKNSNSAKDDNKKNLADYNIFTFSLCSLSININFNLIYKMIDFFFRQNLEYVKNQELFTASVLASIFKKYGNLVSREDYKTIFDFETNGTKPYLYDYYSTIINLFFESFTRAQDIDTLFNNLNINNKKTFFELPEIILILLSELAKIIKDNFKDIDIVNIYQWLYKNIVFILFKRFFKIIKNPKNLFAVNSSIIIEKKNLENFLDARFHSIEWALKFSLLNIIFTKEEYTLEIDDISKKLKNRINDRLPEYIAKYKEIIKYPDSSNSLTNKFDLNSLEEFFNYSLEDNNHHINFSLVHLKFLQKIIIQNIDKIRVLNKEFDLMDIIFFNKNMDYYIGEENGVINLSNVEKYTVQVNLKTRILSNEIQSSLMRCKLCKTICPKEFILSNEENFFVEFNYLENPSKEARMKKVLNTCDLINKKDILEFFRKQIDYNGRSSEFKDNLYSLFDIIAANKKEDLYIEESDILNSDKLLNIMLNEKSIGKEIEDLSKNLLTIYEMMKNQFEYYCNIEKKLKIIENKLVNNRKDSRKTIYIRIKDNIEKGYANKEISEFSRILSSSCKLLFLNKMNQNNDNSRGLHKNLKSDKMSKILPYREFNLKELRDNKIIEEVLHKEVKNVSYNKYNFKFTTSSFVKFFIYYIGICFRLKMSKTNICACE